MSYGAPMPARLDLVVLQSSNELLIMFAEAQPGTATSLPIDPDDHNVINSARDVPSPRGWASSVAGKLSLN